MRAAHMETIASRVGQRFYFHLRPFVAVEQSGPRAQRFGGLELPADLCRGERIIDATAGVAQLLQLRKRIAAAFFLRDDEVDVDLPAVTAIAFSIAHARAGISLINSPRTTSPMAKPTAGSETAPSLSCAIKLS